MSNKINRGDSRIISTLEAQTIFLTGATGFLGKIVLWKILTECPQVQRIYVLIRAKRGVTPAERFEREVLSVFIFEDLLRARPELKGRIVALDGDIAKPGLGLSAQDTAELEREVTLILHCAATTKFMEQLRLAIEMNVLGSKRVLDLAKRCVQLRAMVHVSTCYVNSIRMGYTQIREKIYPLGNNTRKKWLHGTRQSPGHSTVWDPYHVLEYITALSDQEMDRRVMELIAPYPNTYTFSKALGETLLQREVDEAPRLRAPLLIVRPSIVGCAEREPLPGWMDSMIGANGLMLACGLGALHFMRGHQHKVADMIPVDHVANAILAVAASGVWRGMEETVSEYDSSGMPLARRSIPVYHMATSAKNPCRWDWPKSTTVQIFTRQPPKQMMGPAWCFFVANPVLHRALHYAGHVLPAGVADLGRIVTGKKAKFVSATQKLDKAISSLAFFTTNQWFFACDNVDALLDQLNASDRALFEFDVRHLNWEHYFVTYSDGLKKFLLKEDPEELRTTDEITPALRSRL
jgi:fatty acyl-CoA reductase